MEAAIRKVLEDARELDGELSEGGQTAVEGSVLADKDGLTVAVDGRMPKGLTAVLVATLANTASLLEPESEEKPAVVVEHDGDCRQLIVKESGPHVVGLVKRQSVLPPH